MVIWILDMDGGLDDRLASANPGSHRARFEHGEGQASQADDAEELDREFRVIDQMLSMHSALRDRYRRRRTALVLLTMALAILGAGFAFATDKPKITILGVEATRDKWLGVVSLIVLLLGVVDLVTDWSMRARGYGEAAKRLGNLKLKMRACQLAGYQRQAVDRLRAAYDELAPELPPIPERQFAILKARHLRKVEMSRQLSAHPGSAVWLVYVKVLFGRFDA